MAQIEIRRENEDHLKSYLSEYVFDALVRNAVRTEFSSPEEGYVDYNDWTLNLTEINKRLFFDINLDNFNMKECSANWLQRILKDVWIIIGSCYTALCRLRNTESSEMFRNRCSWTGKSDELKHCLDCLYSSEHCTIYTLLYTTTIFENAVTNLYFMFGNKDVVLIRDMLNSESILNLLGKSLVLFIELIIGNSRTLNIRNIVWHGFAVNEEISDYLPAVMLLIIMHTGQLLLANGFVEIPERTHRHIMVTNRFVVASDYFVDFDDIDEETFRSFVRKNDFISSACYPLWDQCYSFYKNKMYGSSILLLLPQLEHLMRCLFVDTNGLPRNGKVARHDEFYVTFDEILSPCSSDNKENQLYRLLGDQIMMMIFDAFVYPTGLRIKDAISHGHLSIKNCSESLCKHMLCIAVCVLVKSFSLMNSDEGIRNQVTNDEYLTSNVLHPITDTIAECVNHYQSLYHPSALLKAQLSNTVTKVKNLKDVSEQIGSSVTLETAEQLPACRPDSLIELKSYIWEKWQIEDTCDIPSKIQENLFNFKLNNIQRLKYNSQCLSTCKRIVEKVDKCCENLEMLIKTKQQQWTNKSMRSRGRKVYLKMLHALPSLVSSFEYLSFLIHFGLLGNCFRINDATESGNLLKFLKQIQTITENIVSHTDINSNKWDNICELINSLSTFMIQYYKSFGTYCS